MKVKVEIEIVPNVENDKKCSINCIFLSATSGLCYLFSERLVHFNVDWSFNRCDRCLAVEIIKDEQISCAKKNFLLEI